MGVSLKNKIYSVSVVALCSVALLCTTGPIMQAFLASLGFDSRALYIHSTLVQAANVVTIFLCAGWADRGNIIRRAAIVQLPRAVLYLAYLPLCLRGGANFSTFAAITGICLLHNGGMLLATTVAAFIPVEALLILTVVLQLYSGFCYFADKEMRAGT